MVIMKRYKCSDQPMRNLSENRDTVHKVMTFSFHWFPTLLLLSSGKDIKTLNYYIKCGNKGLQQVFT